MSIIQDAYETLEKNSGLNHKATSPHWDYISFKFRDGNIYRIVFEYNTQIGEMVRQWMINENIYTTVKDKYDNELIMFDVCNNSIGEREFEKCISYEFLQKPLGIEFKRYLTKYNVLDFLESNNIKYFESQY